MGVVMVVLAFVNTRCHVFFGQNSTTILKFGHGWPVHFQEGPVPGPGQRSLNQSNIIPNYVWGHPEFNGDPKIMAKYSTELRGMPRTPWGLYALAEFSAFGAIFDVLVAFGILVILSLVFETALRSTDRRIRGSG